MSARETARAWRQALPRTSRHGVTRPRVVDLIDRRLPLSVLAAPPGYGKSVALSNWLLRTFGDDDLVVWCDVGALTAPEAVWQHALSCLPGAAVPPAHEAYDALDAWLHEGDAPVVLAVDSSDNLVHAEFLESLVALLRRHPRLYAVVATRQLPDNFVDMAQAVDTVIIGRRDLAFRADDSLELFRSYGLGELREASTVVHEALDGWPTLVHRAVIAIAELFARGEQDRLEVVLREVAERARDHIAGVMLPDLLADDQFELARLCAAVGTVDSDNLHLLVGPADSVDAELVARLEHGVRDLARVGILVARHEVEQSTWTMPDLVAQALRKDDVSLPTDEVQRRFIDHHLARENWPLALSVALLLGDAERLADIVGRSWPFLTMSHEPLLRQAIDPVPEEVLSRHPAASAVQGLLWNSQTQERPDALPDDPEQLDRLAADPAVMDLLLEQMTLMLADRASGRLGRAADSSRKLVHLVDAAESRQPGRVREIAGAIHAQAGVTSQVVGDLRAADEHFRRALAVGGPDPSGTAVRSAQSGLALIDALEGKMDSARRWVEQAAAQPPYPGWLGRRLLTPRLLAETWLALEALDKTALDPLVASLQAQVDDDLLWGHIVTVESIHDLVFEDSWSAIDRLEALRRRRASSAPAGSYADVAITYALTDHLLVLGQGTRALQTLQAAPADHPGSGVRRALIALVSGDPESTLAEGFAGRVSIRRRAHHDLLRAAAHLALGDLGPARASAEMALRRMRTYGLRTPLRFVPTASLVGLLENVDFDPDDRELLLTAVDVLPSPLPESIDVISLTARETAVLNGLHFGLGLQQLAAADYVSVNTIKSQVRSLYRKLGVTKRNEALARAREIGLLAPVLDA